MVQKIVSVKNPVLRSPAKLVQNYDKRVEKLIKDLESTLKAQKDPEGVGLAAPQVGISNRVFVALLGGKIIPFINPEIIWESEETNDPKEAKSEKIKAKSKDNYIMEGCLSLPHYYGPVQRAKRIKVRYQTPESPGTSIKTFRGLPAQIIQHEIDHLNGVIFVDRLLQQKRKLYHWVKDEWKEVELP